MLATAVITLSTSLWKEALSSSSTFLVTANYTDLPHFQSPKPPTAISFPTATKRKKETRPKWQIAPQDAGVDRLATEAPIGEEASGTGTTATATATADATPTTTMTTTTSEETTATTTTTGDGTARGRATQADDRRAATTEKLAGTETAGAAAPARGVVVAGVLVTSATAIITTTRDARGTTAVGPGAAQEATAARSLGTVNTTRSVLLCHVPLCVPFLLTFCGFFPDHRRRSASPVRRSASPPPTAELPTRAKPDAKYLEASGGDHRARGRGCGGSNNSRKEGGPQDEREDDDNGAEPMDEDFDVDDDGMDADMAAMMGFGGFGSTKGKKVVGNNIGAVRKEKKTEYRQYMNRVGGFNRPLSPSR